MKQKINGIVQNGCKLSVLFAAGMVLAVHSAFASVTAHYTFNDAGNGGLNLLKASVGQDAIVRGGKPAADVAGIGELYATNGPKRADGTGAVAIPKGQFLAIPHGLNRSFGQTWFMRMRVFMPREEMHAVFSLTQDNSSDAFLFQKGKKTAGGSLGWSKYSEKKGLPFVGNWTTLLFQCNGSGADLYADGVKILSTHDASPYSEGSDLTGIEYIYIGADNSGEDNLMFVDDVIIGSGMFYDQVVDIPDPGSAIRNGQLRKSALASTSDYAVTSNEGGTEYGFYPVVVSLADPSRKAWEDGSTSDKTLWFAIKDVFTSDVAVHFSFDDDGNGGLNILKADIGEDAWVRGGNPAADISGIGSIVATNGEGRVDGKGAVAIPMGEFLVMAHGVAANQCWRMDMKCLIPSDSLTHRAYFTEYTNNTQDAAMFNFSGLRVGGGANWDGYSADVTSRETWHTLSLRSDGTQTSAWINDEWVHDAKPGRLRSLSESGFIGISGDQSGEDGLMLIDDIKTYVLKDVVKVPIPLNAGSFLATGETFESQIANTPRYAVRGVRPSASEIGEYPVTVGLLDPGHTVWSDGTSDDKTVMFTVSKAANSWKAEPAVGALTWVAGTVSPAYSRGASEFGTVSVYLDGFPFDGELPTAVGTYVLTFAVPASVERCALSKSFTLTVLPAGAALSYPISTDAYVTNGLFMFLDGIENVGAMLHDETSSKWIDVSGNGYDWNIDLNESEWRNDGLYFKGNGMVGIPTTKTSDDFKKRVNTIEFIWNNDRKDHGIIFGPGFNYSSYLYTDTDGSVGFFGVSNKDSTIGVSAVLGEDRAYSIDYIRGESDVKPTGVNSVFTNGVKVAQPIHMNNYWNAGMDKHPLIGNQGEGGANRRAKGTLKTLRLYSRSLTPSERSLNSALDTLRYGIGTLPAEIDIEGYRVEGNALQVRINVASAGGKLSVNGGEYITAETFWVPVGSSITVTGKFKRVKPDRRDAYIREGLPPNAVISEDGAKTTFIANAPASVRIGHPDITDGFFLIIR